MTSTIATNNITSTTGSTITVPTGKKLVGTDQASIYAPGMTIQTQGSSTNTQIVNTTDPYNGVLMTCDITPKFSNSKVLIMMAWWMGWTNPNGALRLNRAISGGATTSLAESASGISDGTGFFAGDDVNESNYSIGNYAFNYLDSPSTTSQVAYKLQADSYYDMYFNTAKINEEL